MVEALLMHPTTKDLYPCRIRVDRDGLILSRVAEADEGDDGPAESDPVGVAWRSLRGFSADESHATPAGDRLQVLEIDSDEGVLTLLVAATQVSVLFAAVGTWSQHWRIARSPIGLVFGGRRRLASRVA